MSSRDRLPIIFSPGTCGGRAIIQGTRLDMKWVYHHRREPYSWVVSYHPQITKQMWDDVVGMVEDILEEIQQ